MDTREIATALTVSLLSGRRDLSGWNETTARNVATFYRHLLKHLDEPLTGDPKAIRLGGPRLNESPPE